MVTTQSPPAASEVVVLTTRDAPGDDKAGPMTTLDLGVENISEKKCHASFIMQIACTKT